MISTILGDKLTNQLSGIFTDFEGPVLQKEVSTTSTTNDGSTSRSGKFISGYWENYGAAVNPGGKDNTKPEYYMNDIKHVTHVIYAFLTLAKNPSVKSPPEAAWDGICIYESMCRDDVMNVLKGFTSDHWFSPRLNALIKAVKSTPEKKFIWAIGGASDLTESVTESQVDSFV